MSYQTNVIRNYSRHPEQGEESPSNSKRSLDSLRMTVFILLFIFLYSQSFAGATWKALSPGIEYQDLQGGIITPWSHVYAFRIDLNYNSLALISAKQLGEKYAAADQFAKRSNALISSNGGFFLNGYWRYDLLKN